MCTFGKTLFYIIYNTGIVELPNIDSFTQTNYFVARETKALVITIPLIYSTNIQPHRQHAAGKLSINTSAAKLSQGSQA